MINVTLLVSRIGDSVDQQLGAVGQRVVTYLEEMGLASPSESRMVVTDHALLVDAGRLERAWRTEAFRRSDLGVIALGSPPIPLDDPVNPASSYQDLIARLRNPSRLSSLLPPFFAAYALPDRWGVVTDYLGVGRAYLLETDSLWIASNHIGAILVAAGKVDQAEDWTAWQIFSGIGWFPLDMSPYQGVRRIPPASIVEFTSPGSFSISEYFPYHEIFGADRRSPTVESAAEEMVLAAANLGAMTRSPLTVQLSGGRDSRVTAAAALRAGIDCTVVTFGEISEEAQTARLLMRSERRSKVEHKVLRSRQSRAMGTIMERGLRCMRIWDADMNPNRLSKPTGGSQLPASISIGGGGGEIAHGNYYATPEMFERVSSLDRPTDRLVAAFGRNPGVTPDSAEKIEVYLDEVHDFLVSCGLKGPSILDGFYLAERTRRWVAAGHNSVSPLLYGAPQFVELAMRLSPEERFAGKLQLELLHVLAPRWADVPFFKASPAAVDQVAARGLRLWQGRQADEFYARLSDAIRDPLWDGASVADLVAKVRGGDAERRMESTFQKVLWRQSFSEHRTEMKRWLSDYKRRQR